MKDKFRVVATKVSSWAGSPYGFIIALLIIVLWAVSGPAAGYSDTWQLIINTGTTIVTFLMVFLIQNTQNRDNSAVHLKLDELIRANKSARDSFLSLEDITDAELLEIAEEFKKLREKTEPIPSIQKLNRKLEAEHAKRMNIRGVGEHVAGAILNPLGRQKNDTKK